MFERWNYLQILARACCHHGRWWSKCESRTDCHLGGRTFDTCWVIWWQSFSCQKFLWTRHTALAERAILLWIPVYAYIVAMEERWPCGERPWPCNFTWKCNKYIIFHEECYHIWPEAVVSDLRVTWVLTAHITFVPLLTDTTSQMHHVLWSVCISVHLILDPETCAEASLTQVNL